MKVSKMKRKASQQLLFRKVGSWVLLILAAMPLDIPVAQGQVGSGARTVDVKLTNVPLIGKFDGTFRFELTLLDPQLVRPTEQTLYVLLSNGNTFPVVFAPGSSKATVEPTLNFQMNQGWWRIAVSRDNDPTFSPRPAILGYSEVHTIALGPQRSQSFNKQMLFVYDDPPLRTAMAIKITLRKVLDNMTSPTPIIAEFFNPSINKQPPTIGFLSDVLGESLESEVKLQIKRLSNYSFSGDLDALASKSFVDCINLDDLPRNWRGLTVAEMIFIPAADLSKLAAENPDRVDALRKWTSLGGRLVVFDCGPAFEKIHNVFPNLLKNSQYEASERGEEKWFYSKLTDQENIFAELDKLDDQAQQQNSQIPTPYIKANVPNPYVQYQPLGNLWAESRRTHLQKLTPSQPIECKFSAAECQSNSLLFADFGLGRILAVRSDLTDFSKNDWRSLLGTSEIFGSHDFENLASSIDLNIIGVGQPPRFTFLTLITLFAFLVGPVAFVYLKIKRRPNYMLIIVPAFSFVCTLGLTAYGLLTDGFSFRTTRVANSFLDSQHGIVSTNTQNAVYSGVTPRPYAFTTDTQVLNWQGSNPFRQQRKIPKVFSTESGTIFSGGEYRTRTKHNVNTLSVKNTELQFLVTPQRQSVQDPKSASFKSRNELGIEAEAVIARFGDEFLFCEHLSAGQSGPMELIDASLLEKKLKALSDELANTQTVTNSSAVFYPSPGRPIDLHQKFVVFRKDSLAHSTESLRDGEFLVITRNCPWAEDLNPNPIYTFQIHFVYGKW